MSLQDEDLASTQLPQVKEKPRSVLDSDDDTAAEQDAFEDAVDATDVADTTSIRSLTKRSTSTTLTRPTLPDEDEDEEEDGDEKEDHPLKEDEAQEDEEDKAVTEQTDHTEPAEPAEPTEPTEPTEETEEEQNLEEDEHNKTDKANAHEEKPSPATVENELNPEPRRDSTSQSERLSSDSNLDNVDLDDDTTPPPQPQPKEAVTPAKKNPEASKSISLTSVFPSLPWSPPSAEASKAATATTQAPLNPSPAPATTARKLTSPFSWLSRNSSKDKEKEREREREREREKDKDKDKGKDKDKEKEKAGSASATDRRNTASSINSNPEMMLSRLEEEKRNATGDKLSRESLKDRFKVLRMQQEASGPPALLSTDEKTLGAKVGGEDALADVPPTSPVPPPNNSLAPGTASGINAGPSALTESSQVDWDLWQSVVYEGPAAVARSSAEELNKAIATGIPNAIRGVIWQVLAQSKNEDLEVVYRDLVARGTEKDKNRHSSSTATSSFSNGNLSVQSVQSVQSGEGVASSASSIKSDNSAGSSAKAEKNSEAVAKAQAAVAAERKRKEKEDAANLVKLEKVIRRDLGARTSYSKYAAAAGLQDGLFGVCKAYALFDEGVGYAQGMNFLIMPLLFNMPEQEVFCLLVRLMNHYGLRDLFIQDMPGLHMHLYQFERLLEDLEPALYCHLHRKGISPHLYATQWFLTLFAYRFPLQLVLRIYDMILSEGLSAIIRFGIVLMQKNTTTLLGLSDMQQLTTYLKDKLFDVYIDKDPSQGSLLENGFFGSSSSSMDKEVYRADQLVHDACEVKISPEILKTYQAEWEEKTKVEKARETELQDLRSSSQSLGQQVRKLEERVEVADREQASLATELVHTKVENDELKDEVEALRAQVSDLKAVIEKQPLEIEEIWKLERDDLMKRNERVHLENEKVEKELLELEEELVQTKLRYAEIYAQHEALTRKWTDVKRQFA